MTALLNQHLGEARAKWGLRDSQPVDVVIYAHGGLTSDDVATREKILSLIKG